MMDGDDVPNLNPHRKIILEKKKLEKEDYIFNKKKDYLNHLWFSKFQSDKFLELPEPELKKKELYKFIEELIEIYNSSKKDERERREEYKIKDLMEIIKRNLDFQNSQFHILSILLVEMAKSELWREMILELNGLDILQGKKNKKKTIFFSMKT